MPEIINWLVSITNKDGITRKIECIAYDDCKFGNELDYDTKRALKYAGVTISNKNFELSNYKFKQQKLTSHGYSNETINN